jgi:hypothetical protein
VRTGDRSTTSPPPGWLFLQRREFGAAVVALAIYHGAFHRRGVRVGQGALPVSDLNGSGSREREIRLQSALLAW